MLIKMLWEPVATPHVQEHQFTYYANFDTVMYQEVIQISFEFTFRPLGNTFHFMKHGAYCSE